MNDDLDPLAIARLFQSVPRLSFLAALMAVAPAYEARGLLDRDKLRPIIAILARPSEVPHAALGLSVDDLFRVPSREQEISALYAELRALAAADHGVDPARDARYQERLRRLRELQEEEAREMAAFAAQRRQLPLGSAESAFSRIDALLETHENAAGSDPSSDDRG